MHKKQEKYALPVPRCCFLGASSRTQFFLTKQTFLLEVKKSTLMIMLGRPTGRHDHRRHIDIRGVPAEEEVADEGKHPAGKGRLREKFRYNNLYVTHIVMY